MKFDVYASTEIMEESAVSALINTLSRNWTGVTFTTEVRDRFPETEEPEENPQQLFVIFAEGTFVSNTLADYVRRSIRIYFDGVTDGHERCQAYYENIIHGE